MKNIVVVDNTDHWQLPSDDVLVIGARDYIANNTFSENKKIRIFNLCKSYRYQALGYYVSLLAEARKHKVIPSVSTIQDFKSQTIIRSISDELDSLFQKSLKRIKSPTFTLSIYFGENFAVQYEELCKQLYNLFPSPLLRANFVFNKRWTLQNISPIPLSDIPESHLPFVQECAKAYFAKKRHFEPKIVNPLYDLAILVDPEEKSPPSNKQAIQNFIHAAEKENIHVELLTKNDYDRIEEFDALFIRTTTAVDHYTYRFARRALTEGMAVIDDPDSIMRCSNKVYLAEILHNAKIPTPKTLIVHKQNRQLIPTEIGFPCVLKLPDSSFSQGVVKAKDQAELDAELEKMFVDSELIIAQSFTPTEYDWRIGILDRQVIFACKYFMAKNHWQIYDWENKKKSNGDYETLPLNEVPKIVIKTALAATNLIGNGLYGVDLKQMKDEVLMIEVNDNPNIDNRVEDQVLKSELYEKVIHSFTKRVKALRIQKEVQL